MIAPFLGFSLVNLHKPENESQFRLTKGFNSTEKIDFLIRISVPVTLFSNMLTIRDTNKSFILDGDLLNTMTNYKFNHDHSNPQDRNKNHEFR